MHRRRSVSAPIILVFPLSASHSFASFYLSQYLHSSFSRVCLLSFSISKLHSSHILFTFYPLPSVPSSLQRRHVFTLSSLLRATSLFPTENSAAAGEPVPAAILTWSHPGSGLFGSQPLHVCCPLTSATNASDFNITLATSEM